MPAKKPAPKAAKGKKAASHPAVKKAVVTARKLPAERVTTAAAHVRKPAPAPMRAAAHPFSTTTEETIEMRKAAPAAPEVEPKDSPSAPSDSLAPTRAGLAQLQGQAETSVVAVRVMAG